MKSSSTPTRNKSTPKNRKTPLSSKRNKAVRTAFDADDSDFSLDTTSESESEDDFFSESSSDETDKENGKDPMKSRQTPLTKVLGGRLKDGDRLLSLRISSKKYDSDKESVQTPAKSSNIHSFGSNEDTPNTRGRKLARKRAVRAVVNRLRDDVAEVDESDVDIYEHVDKSISPLKLARRPFDSDDSDDALSSSPKKLNFDGEDLSESGKKLRLGNSYMNYFQHQQDVSHLKTSNSTLSDLNLPVLELKKFRDLLDEVDGKLIENAQKSRSRKKVLPKNFTAKKRLLSQYEETFPEWEYELDEGFNIMVYGIGDKKPVLNKFVDYCVSKRKEAENEDGFHDLMVNINGVFPGINIREILIGVLSELQERDLERHENKLISSEQFESNDFSSKGSIAELVGKIRQYYRRPWNQSTSKLWLVVHCLDGPPLRQNLTYQCLANLSVLRNIHLCCSADNINFPLLFDTSINNIFRFIYHEVTTFLSWDTEWILSSIGGQAASVLSCLDVSGFANVAGNLGSTIGDVRGMLFVLFSLPKNSRDIFRVLVEHQLEEMSADSENDIPEKKHLSVNEIQGLPYSSFLRTCKNRFLTGSDQSFRTQLTEFKDHQMIFSRLGDDGEEILLIPLGVKGLETLLEQM